MTELQCKHTFFFSLNVSLLLFWDAIFVKLHPAFTTSEQLPGTQWLFQEDIFNSLDVTVAEGGGGRGRKDSDQHETHHHWSAALNPSCKQEAFQTAAWRTLTLCRSKQWERQTFNSLIWLLGFSVHISGGGATRRHLKKAQAIFFFSFVFRICFIFFSFTSSVFHPICYFGIFVSYSNLINMEWN